MLNDVGSSFSTEETTIGASSQISSDSSQVLVASEKERSQQRDATSASKGQSQEKEDQSHGAGMLLIGIARIKVI